MDQMNITAADVAEANTPTREGTATIYLNEQHTLLPSQTAALDARFESWHLIPVPATGWTLDEMRQVVATVRPFTNVVMGSPIPVLIGWLASQARDGAYGAFVFHNDRRVAKEITDRETGQIKVIHTIAPDGWELVRVG